MPRFQGTHVSKPRFGGLPVDVAPVEPESQVSQDTRAQLSEFTQHPSRGAFDALPTWQKPLQAADDIVRLIAQGGSMGFADKVAAGGDPQRLEAERAMTEAARDRAGWAGTTAELGGAMATPVGMAQRGMTLVGKGAQALPGLKGLLARTLLMGGEGAGYGAASAAGNDQDIGQGAASGAILGGAGNVFGEGVGHIMSGVGQMLAKAPPAATKDELFAAGNAAYKAADDAGIIIKPEGMQALHSNIVKDFTDFGFDPALQPRAAAVLARVEKDAGNNVTLKGLDTIRKVASNAYDPMNKGNNALIGKVIGHIDDLIKSEDPSLMAGIDTKAGAAAIKEARKQWHTASKLDTVEKLIEKGNQQADRNITDTRVKSVKSQLGKINDPFSNWGRGFTDEEKAAAAKAARYTTLQRLLHGASVLNPGGGGKLSAAMQLAFAMAHGFNPALLAGQAAGAVAGHGFQKAGEALAGKSVRELTDLVSRGGRPAPKMPEHALERLSKPTRDLLVRALLGGGLAAGQQ